MSRLTTYMTCMDAEMHKVSFKCVPSLRESLGINDKAKYVMCHMQSCLTCAFYKHVPFEVEAKLTPKESNHE